MNVEPGGGGGGVGFHVRAVDQGPCRVRQEGCERRGVATIEDVWVERWQRNLGEDFAGADVDRDRRRRTGWRCPSGHLGWKPGLDCGAEGLGGGALEVEVDREFEVRTGLGGERAEFAQFSSSWIGDDEPTSWLAS